MFYYEYISMGKWCPAVKATRPTGKRSEGGKYEVQNLHQLTAEQRGMSLDELFKLFNPVGSQKPLTAPDGLA